MAKRTQAKNVGDGVSATVDFERDQLGLPTKTKMGRPSKHTPELEADLLERMKLRTLYQICRDDDDMPHLATIARWTSKSPTFATACAEARRFYAQNWVDKTIALVDECGEKNWKSTKVKAWYALEIAQRVLPKIYGLQNRVDVNHNVNIERIMVPESMRPNTQLAAPVPPPNFIEGEIVPPLEGNADTLLQLGMLHVSEAEEQDNVTNSSE